MARRRYWNESKAEQVLSAWQSRWTEPAMAASGVDKLDIPAFLRKQAD